jgi:hypothetical protein
LWFIFEFKEALFIFHRFSQLYSNGILPLLMDVRCTQIRTFSWCNLSTSQKLSSHGSKSLLSVYHLYTKFSFFFHLLRNKIFCLLSKRGHLLVSISVHRILPAANSQWGQQFYVRGKLRHNALDTSEILWQMPHATLYLHYSHIASTLKLYLIGKYYLH